MKVHASVSRTCSRTGLNDATNPIQIWGRYSFGVSTKSSCVKFNFFFTNHNRIMPWGFGEHRFRFFFLARNKGQLRAAVTRPCRLSTPLCHTYSEPSGHELSPGGTQNIPYLFKNLSKSRLSDPFFGLFLVISEVGSQIYIANLAIECFQQLFGMKSHCMP